MVPFATSEPGTRDRPRNSVRRSPRCPANAASSSRSFAGLCRLSLAFSGMTGWSAPCSPAATDCGHLWCGSISHAETVPLDPRLSEAIGHLLRAVGWCGLFQVDLFEQSGGFVVIDLNPRVYTSLSHAVRAGLNLPGIWVDLLLGRVPHVPASYRVGVRYRHDEGDLRALARMLTHGPRMAAMRGLVPRRDTALAVFSYQGSVASDDVASPPGASPRPCRCQRSSRTALTTMVGPRRCGLIHDAARCHPMRRVHRERATPFACLASLSLHRLPVGHRPYRRRAP